MSAKIGKPAPDFKATAVIDGSFKDISLKDYKGKYVVLFFYPLDFTFVCPTELISFSDRIEEFRQINCEVVACSTDSHFSHLAWIETDRKQGGLGKMNIPLLADKNMEICIKYGVLKDDEGIAFRGLFIIDSHGTLRQITINDLPVGRSVDETLRLVQAFQFANKSDEECLAEQKTGKKTINPDVSKSKEYLEHANRRGTKLSPSRLPPVKMLTEQYRQEKRRQIQLSTERIINKQNIDTKKVSKVLS